VWGAIQQMLIGYALYNVAGAGFDKDLDVSSAACKCIQLFFNIACIDITINIS